jgi:hypothetical protein
VNGVGMEWRNFWFSFDIVVLDPDRDEPSDSYLLGISVLLDPEQSFIDTNRDNNEGYFSSSFSVD